jgi:hypothetical protein
VGDLDERELLEHVPLTGLQRSRPARTTLIARDRSDGRPRLTVQYRTGSWCG